MRWVVRRVEMLAGCRSSVGGGSLAGCWHPSVGSFSGMSREGMGVGEGRLEGCRRHWGHGLLGSEAGERQKGGAGERAGD